MSWVSNNKLATTLRHLYCQCQKNPPERNVFCFLFVTYSMTDTMSTWPHIRTLTDGDWFELNGLNIWDHDWMNTAEKIQIKDPLYAQDYTFTVYEITNGPVAVAFAAGEFSNGVWGIYLKKN
ncbi:conserved hypothetical protein [Cytophaga hutchinsonii ATCC 33406]|uniref:Uncharacterized protein n=2 Tax=Cytophaga hutchinsonii TaxID=985 RepID=A0A6N4SN63_CYTH3|nr:conserved hypothetical protein [Cytophaga hutchinsonii ATCC 33406]